MNPALRVCGFWLMGSRSVVVEAAREKSDVIWERLAKLFTTLSFENPEYMANEAVTSRLEECRSTNVGRVYPEDYRMKGIKAFDKSMKSLDWNREGETDQYDNVSVYSSVQSLISGIPVDGFAIFRGYTASST